MQYGNINKYSKHKHGNFNGGIKNLMGDGNFNFVTITDAMLWVIFVITGYYFFVITGYIEINVDLFRLVKFVPKNSMFTWLEMTSLVLIL